LTIWLKISGSDIMLHETLIEDLKFYYQNNEIT
jgi:hypothetical protein